MKKFLFLFMMLLISSLTISAHTHGGGCSPMTPEEQKLMYGVFLCGMCLCCGFMLGTIMYGNSKWAYRRRIQRMSISEKKKEIKMWEIFSHFA